jgi:hypothetical protein
VAITAEILFFVLRHHADECAVLGEPFDAAMHFVRVEPGVCEPIAAMSALPNQEMKQALRNLGFHTLRARHATGAGMFYVTDHSLREYGK